MLLPPLIRARLLKRYKRFLADVQLEDGTIDTVHCPNTGAMTSCWKPDALVELSVSQNPNRKYAMTLERIDMGAGWIGINTHRVNAVILEAIRAHRIKGFEGYGCAQSEPVVDFGQLPKSRLDILLKENGLPNVYIEIKNATLLIGDEIKFPDAVTIRGRKHLDLLSYAVDGGNRGVIVFAINRPEGRYFSVANEIDPDYSAALHRAIESGVEVIVVRLKHEPQAIRVAGSFHYVTPPEESICEI